MLRCNIVAIKSAGMTYDLLIEALHLLPRRPMRIGFTPPPRNRPSLKTPTPPPPGLGVFFCQLARLSEPLWRGRRNAPQNRALGAGRVYRRAMRSKANGYVFALLAIVIFSIQDGLSKHLGANYPPVFVAMIRYWAFAAFAVTLAWRSPAGLRATAVTKRPLLQVSRGVLLPAQIVVVITAFTIVGLAHSQAILAATPIFVALLSMPLLGERVGWRRWSAITAGLVGVLLILKPGEGTFEVDFLLPLAGALMFAVYAITTRLVSRDDSALTSFFYSGVVGAAAISLVGPFFWATLTGPDWVWMLLLCVTGSLSHYFLIRAYDLLDAVAVQPLTYLQLVLASIMGVSIFGETLTVNMIIGSLLVVAAGIFTVWRERVVARRKAGLPPV
ncbi:S-adenosylmethionine uptake transporter Sam [Sinorhizobium fredii USDA 257]|uniref:S-adenosylmethionine uptake transporter Sam n=2 Tax=Rhizobium fredii TaxID=380 RepID=I3XF58_SINF2|nr:S-adenosylmethionine uptake transporter Sam [Sinorhizobium fredii USDA 257]